MFRDDRDALAQKVDDLRAEQERLQAENEAMRKDLLVRRQYTPPTQVRRNVYKAGIEVLSPGERVALTRHDVTSFPPWAAVLLHFVTFGLFSLIHFSLLHDKLPKAENDDPTAGRAIGFSFLPYFNFYWIVFNTARLVDRINLQFRLRGEPDALPRGFLIACAVIGVIPYVNFVFGFFIFWPLAVYYLQRAANRLADLPRDGAPVRPAAWSPMAAQPLPQPQPRLRVGDLPGPDEVAQQAEAEAAEAEAARARVIR